MLRSLKITPWFLILGTGIWFAQGCKPGYFPTNPPPPLFTLTPVTSSSPTPTSVTGLPTQTFTATSTSTFTGSPTQVPQSPTPTFTFSPTPVPSPAVSPTPAPTGTFHYKMEWGGEFDVNTSLLAGLATDSSGNVYACNGNFVVKYDGNGNLITRWGTMGTGNGQFYAASGVGVDGSNKVYVVDYGQDRVQVFDANGSYLSQFNVGGASAVPWYLAVSKSGTSYVMQNGYGSVAEFDSNGNPILQWGTPGTGPGQFQNATAITFDPTEQYLYVGDLYRVQKFDTNGNFILQWGSQGTGNGQFQGAVHALATDAAGNVYAADGTRIEVFDANGNYLFQFGSYVMPPGNLSGPYFDWVTYGLAVNRSTGDVYAVNSFWPGGYIERWGY